MKNYPASPELIFDKYTRDWQTAFGNALESVSLYGSAARGEYIPGKSDINFLIVLTPAGIGNLRAAIELTEKWRRQNVAVPLVLTRAYIDNSLDTFPIEFLSMREHHKVVFGEDPLGSLHISKANLRLQIEREIKGKLLHLRESLLAEGFSRDRLLALLRQTLPAFNPLFEALLYLRDEPIPSQRREVFARVAELARIDKAFCERLFRVTTQESKPYRSELWDLFEKYLLQIRELTVFIDAMDKTE